VNENILSASMTSSKWLLIPISFVICSVSFACGDYSQVISEPLETSMSTIALPTPEMDGDMSLEETLQTRRSVRSFLDEPLELSEISQLLWAAQGITDSSGKRTAPSAGALYPLEVYLVSKDGVYHYNPREHSLTSVREGDLRSELCRVALDQEMILEAPVTIVFTAVFERTEKKYGSARSARYVHMEVGHAAQNVLLQAVALNLGATPAGAFQDEGVHSVLGLPHDHEPLYLIPIGRPK
jgi:SagB-type dehydrogenase family enzyme